MKQNASNATPVKREIDVELALRWAWCDELSKRSTSAAEAVWDRIDDFGRHGGIDVDAGSGPQRYDFGAPDPDAEALERAVAKLDPVAFDWSRRLEEIAGPLSGLVKVNDFKHDPVRRTTVGWGNAGDRALRGWFGPGGVQPRQDRPRDVVMLGTFNPRALVTLYAVRGTRPDWREEEPQPLRVPAEKSANVKVVGECEGKNRYSAGAFCPLKWEPSPTSVLEARAEYLTWIEALDRIVEIAELSKIKLLPPSAPRAPWFGDNETAGTVIHVPPTSPLAHLPLAPSRDRKLSPLRRSPASPGEHLYSKANPESAR